MHQLSLLDTLSRRTDPVTSHLAAKEAVENGTVAGHEALILAVVRAEPGLTAAEIGVRCGLSNVQVTRRYEGLNRKGLVRYGAVKVCGVKHRKMVTWWPI